MEKKIIIEMLSKDRVYIKKQKITVIDGIEYEIGEPERICYDNSERGRSRLEKEVAEPYLTSIKNVWGSNATVLEKEVLQ